MNAYLLPVSTHDLKDNFFKRREPDYQGGKTNVIFWDEFGDALKRAGLTAHTFDFWSRDISKPDDILIVINEPRESVFWRTYRWIVLRLQGIEDFSKTRRDFVSINFHYFTKRVLLQLEPPMVMPYVYKNFDSLSREGIYTKVFSVCRGFPGKYSYFNYYANRSRSILSPYFKNQKSKFLAMVNGNTMPHDLQNEYYSERLKAIKYFSARPDFDLYGFRWDRMPRHPFYFHYGKYALRAWRGTAHDKLETLSRYKFCLCFENCAYPGYVSEKIYDCLAVGAIPIYLGAPDIQGIVPPECFIDFRKFTGYSELEKFLRSLTEEKLEGYRKNILTFLTDESTIRGIDLFVREMIGE